MHIEQLLEIFCTYSKFIKGLSDNTIKRYSENINNFISLSEVNHFDDINEQKVLAFFFKGRVERKWKSTTYRTYYMTLIVFFDWAVANGHLETNYVKGIELPKIPKSLPKNLSKQQTNLILETTLNFPCSHRFIRYRNHAILSTFVFAGIRKDELFKLTLDDVDIENRTLFINGKGEKQRIIPISYRLAEILKRYLKERQKLKKTCPAFFTSFRLNKAYTDAGLRRVVKSIRECSGVYFRPHVLRHTFATLMLEGGCDVYSLSKMMGHNDIKTTTLYLSASAEHLRSVLMKHPLEKNSF
ncbi:tyrosine-type recombinase/integrase [Olleya sp. UBA1516]|uniref:tyrosine-type recombinase/integrase n=1 Tax=Olleya sp. UBA1516 TaxID=1947013 RepID=UPI0025D425BC|nr:tyrosine-type recombinase/integrase [Olleya sp. UBA1516]|tara:strand:+ start:5215 stop:6111 length:897 start_codon:yes stop_codon:yes gene_type:complete